MIAICFCVENSFPELGAGWRYMGGWAVRSRKQCTKWAVLVGGVGGLAGCCDRRVELEDEHRLAIVLLPYVVVFIVDLTG